jgi:hypothetical protein
MIKKTRIKGKHLRPCVTKLTLRRTPVIYWQETIAAGYHSTRNRQNQLNRDVLVHITRKLELWGVLIPDHLDVLIDLFPNNLPGYFESLSYILSIDEIRDGEFRVESDYPVSYLTAH